MQSRGWSVRCIVEPSIESIHTMEKAHVMFNEYSTSPTMQHVLLFVLHVSGADCGEIRW